MNIISKTGSLKGDECHYSLFNINFNPQNDYSYDLLISEKAVSGIDCVENFSNTRGLIVSDDSSVEIKAQKVTLKGSNKVMSGGNMAVSAKNVEINGSFKVDENSVFTIQNIER